MYVATRVSLMPAVVPAVPVPAVAGASAVVAVRHWVGVVTVVAAAHESDRYRRAGATRRCSPRRAAPFRAVPSGARQCRAVPDVTRFRAMARHHRRRALGGVVALVLCARVRTGACSERARIVSWRRWAYSRDLGRRVSRPIGWWRQSIVAALPGRRHPFCGGTRGRADALPGACPYGRAAGRPDTGLRDRTASGSVIRRRDRAADGSGTGRRGGKGAVRVWVGALVVAGPFPTHSAEQRPRLSVPSRAGRTSADGRRGLGENPKSALYRRGSHQGQGASSRAVGAGPRPTPPGTSDWRAWHMSAVLEPDVCRRQHTVTAAVIFIGASAKEAFHGI